MALLGKAALAMWWDMAPGSVAEFEHWHSHEHFPERLGIPGFHRASRWRSADGGDGIFVMYELEDHDVLSSQAYLARLNSPTPWSTRMMPHHREMVRSQCRVLESRGCAVAGHALTIRLSPAPGRDETLRSAIRALADRLAAAPGIAGIHLLRHETPPIPPTEEQRIRGHSDRMADWVLVVCGYDPGALAAADGSVLDDTALAAMGAAAGAWRGLYRLSLSSTPSDIA